MGGGEAAEGQMALDPILLDILACPECKVRVEQQGDRLICVRCGRRYRIDDGIPVMLLDEAEPPPADWTPREESGEPREDAAPPSASA
jgi:uncharacterized protein YbaR (Trm112 family)